jgi:hypothetical protein
MNFKLSSLSVYKTAVRLLFAACWGCAPEADGNHEANIKFWLNLLANSGCASALLSLRSISTLLKSVRDKAVAEGIHLTPPIVIRQS